MKDKNKESFHKKLLNNGFYMGLFVALVGLIAIVYLYI